MPASVALVTGSGSSIGAAIAHRLAADGMAIAVADIDSASAAKTAAEISATGATAAAFTSDVSSSSDRKSLVSAVNRELGDVAVLVNNAADHGPRKRLTEVEDSEWEHVIATNLTASAALSALLAPSMMQTGAGCIVNIVAIQADSPIPTYAPYAASKGGMISLTRALAVELSPHGIRVNAVAPGGIESGSTAAALGGKDGRTLSLLGKAGTPSDVAATVSFLCSRDAAFITGAVFTVDGGRHLMRPADPLTDPAAETVR